MKELLKSLLKKTPLYQPIINHIENKLLKQELSDWEKNGQPAPPPHLIKQRVLRSYAKEFSLKTLVETGTYLGDMVAAMQDDFEKIYSIELSQELYEKAKLRFQDSAKIELLQGDSGTELGNLIKRIDQPTLFWLDGHYSAGITARGEKDTPIFEELSHIYSSKLKTHVIIVDDARCFGNDPAYPTLDELTTFVKSKRPDSKIVVEYDSIRITPN